MAINSDIQQQVFDLLSRASNLSFVSAEQEGGGRIALTPGQRVTGEVISSLPNNMAQVQVGTNQYKLELPMAVRAGQSLSMTFVASEPRDTFAIARQGVMAPPVSLSDASRLLALLAGSEQIADSSQRASLQSIGDMLRRSSGEAGVLANLMDEALTYGSSGDAGNRAAAGAAGQRAMETITPEGARLARFEANASQILQNIARSSRFILAEAVNTPVTPLPLMPGEEVDAAVLGTLPGNRVFVQVTGSDLELQLARQVKAGDVLKLTFISSQPTPLFALARSVPGTAPGSLSETGRWLSVLEHAEGGVSGQQLYVLERLNTVLKNLPADSPAFTAIQDEAITYQTVMKGNRPAVETEAAPQQASLRQGNGIVLSDDMARLLQALIKGNRLALLEALNQPMVPLGLAPGQQIKGEILAALGGGAFMVQVGKQVLEFSMPKGTQKGDLVNLFFINDKPGPTFLMARFGRPGDSAVSETGRWLSGFLGATAERMQTREAMGLLRTLLSGPPMDALEVAARLQHGMRESGLFYEAHLAQWFGGEYPLEELLREPQGRLSVLKQIAPGQPGNPAPEAQSGPGMKAASLELMEAAFKKAGNIPDHEGAVDNRIQSVVREQLESLQSGQFLFRGDLFSGQPVNWAISERESGRNKNGEMERAWETSLQLDLPRLGGIYARLKVDGGNVSIQVHVDEAATAVKLTSGKKALMEQLQSAGLSPGEIGISHEAQ